MHNPLLSIKKEKIQINENISKSTKRITRFISKEDTLPISEIFEGNDCLQNFKDFLSNQSQKLELVKKILCYLSSQDLNFLPTSNF